MTLAHNRIRNQNRQSRRARRSALAFKVLLSARAYAALDLIMVRGRVMLSAPTHTALDLIMVRVTDLLEAVAPGKVAR